MGPNTEKVRKSPKKKAESNGFCEYPIRLRKSDQYQEIRTCGPDEKIPHLQTRSPISVVTVDVKHRIKPEHQFCTLLISNCVLHQKISPREFAALLIFCTDSSNGKILIRKTNGWYRH